MNGISGVGGLTSTSGIDTSFYESVQQQARDLVQFQARIGQQAAEIQATSGAINMAVRALQAAAANVRA